MKNIFGKIMLSAAVVSILGGATSCADKLDLSPEDWYTANNFWTEKSQFEGNIFALSNQFRDFTSQILWSQGELRGGAFYLGTLADGSGSASEDIIRNQLTPSTSQFSNFGGYWGVIANLNELLYRIENQSEGILDEKTADGLSAMAYGWRAYCYFQMYRMYGGLPIRTMPDVQLGDYVPEHLYKARSTAEETLNFIKEDVKKSIDLFTSSEYKFLNGTTADFYWNKAASELLAGQVYLWSGKVATGDHAANAADVTTAKTYFSNVIKNYGYELQSNFFNIWLTPNNKESIFATCYSSEDDGAYYGTQTNLNWAYTTGAARGALWSTWGPTGYEKVNGKACRFGKWVENGIESDTQYDLKLRLGVQRYQYKNALFFQFDEKDTRSNAFYPVYNTTAVEQANNVRVIDEFDPTQYDLAGTFVIKMRYSTVSGSDYWACKVGMPLMRLPDAILGMAECCNYEDDKTGVETYINMLRKRAYGGNWDEATYGYTAGSFKDNEVAILQESDKEFFLEGHRWFDLRRLTTVKGGKQTDHLVFQPEGCIGWGLPVASSSWMKENDGSPCETSSPVLPTEWEYRLLWPLNTSLLGSDPLLEQNPGY